MLAREPFRFADRLGAVRVRSDDEHAVHLDAVLVEGVDRTLDILAGLVLVEALERAGIDGFEADEYPVAIGAPHQVQGFAVA